MKDISNLNHIKEKKCKTTMDLLGIGWDGVDWIDLVQDRYRWRVLLNSVMNLRVP
jgi:hypothetical protein